MNTEPSLENESDLTKRIESPASSVESKAEVKESYYEEGAELLENPPGGKWPRALQVFSDWVKKLFAK